MQALTVYQQNFTVAERLLQQYQLASNLTWPKPPEKLLGALPDSWGEGASSAVQLATNDHVIILFRPAARIPGSLRVAGGLDFLLRQAIVVACTALETFLWETMRDCALTIVRARRRGADEELRNLTLTLEEYVSLDKVADPDERLRQILLTKFDHHVLHNLEAIDRVARMLTVKTFWQRVEEVSGTPATSLRALVGELVARRNLITHRADRAGEGEPVDGHGLRPISLAWTNMRLQATNTLVTASAEVFSKALMRLAKDAGQNVRSH